MSGPIIVFAGPCLSGATDGPDGEAWRRRLGRVELWPPARRGDIFRALGRSPSVLVLLDGFFYSVPSVTHKELLYALDAGVPVVGAASLGALRAAELESFGMLGVGEVFERFRDGVLDGDDEVALLHASAEQDYRPLTAALVDVRDAVSRLELGEAGEQWIRRLASRPFTERYLGGTECVEILGEEDCARLVQAVRTDGVKKRDAKLAIDLAIAVSSSDADVDLPSDRASSRPHGRQARHSETLFAGYFRERRSAPSIDAPDAASPTFTAAWQMAQLFHPEVESFVCRERQRFLLVSAARRSGLEVDPARLETLQESLSGLAVPGATLPPVDLRDEARRRLLAELAWEHFGDWREIAAGATRDLPADAEKQLAHLEAQGELMGSWPLIRAFSLTAAAGHAVELAREAEQIHKAFRRWACRQQAAPSGPPAGARVQSRQLIELASRLFSCRPLDVPKRAGRRALYYSDGYADGLLEVLEKVAAAERLETPLNRYVACREALEATPLGVAEPWTF